MATILLFLISWLIGFLLASLTFAKINQWSGLFLACCTGIGLGVTTNSILYFFWILTFRSFASRNFYLGLQICLVIVLIVIAIKARIFPRPHIESHKLDFKKIWNSFSILEVLCILVLAINTVRFLNDWLYVLYLKPIGDWDAWAIWTLRARFIDSIPNWQNGFSSVILWSHPDYPLQLPSFIAHIWYIAGNQSQYVPALVNLIFSIGTLGLVTTSISIVRGRQAGIIAGIFIIELLDYSTGFFELADLPLAFFILATNIVLYFVYIKSDKDPKLLFLAGFLIGGALWTKNEGIAFLIAVVLSEIAWYVFNRVNFPVLIRRWLYLTIGILPVFIAWLIFKLTLAPANDIVSGTALQTTLLDFSRYQYTFSQFVSNFFYSWTTKVPFIPLLFFYLFIVGFASRKKELKYAIPIAMRLTILSVIYFGIYIITPHDLAWHIQSSLYRLVFHITPSLVFLAFLVAKNPFSKNLIENPREIEAYP